MKLIWPSPSVTSGGNVWCGALSSVSPNRQLLKREWPFSSLSQSRALERARVPNQQW